MNSEISYQEALARSIEWQQKADQAATTILKSALEAVARDYVRLAAEIRTRQAQQANSAAACLTKTPLRAPSK
jgi:hypothetical protein